MLNILIFLLSLYVIEATIECPTNSTLTTDIINETFFAAKVQVVKVEAKGNQNQGFYEYTINYVKFYFTKSTMYKTKINAPTRVKVDKRCGPPLVNGRIYAIGYYWYNEFLFVRPFEELTQWETVLLHSRWSPAF